MQSSINRLASAAIAVVLCGCSVTEPITGKMSDGRTFTGSATASFSEGSFETRTADGLTCRGDYNQWDTARIITAKLDCSDGRHGGVTITRNPNLMSGTGSGSLNDGTKVEFTFGSPTS